MFCINFDRTYSGINQYTNPSYLARLPLGTTTMSIVGGHTSQYTNPSYLAGLPLGTTTMSIVGGHTSQYTNPSYLAGLPLGTTTMSIVDGHTSQYTNPSYLAGLPLGTTTMSIVDGHTSQYTNPSYLAGLPLGTTTMSIVGGHTSQYANLSYLAGLPLGTMTMSIVDGHTSQYMNPSYLIGSSSHTVGGHTIQYINHNYFVDTVNLISHYKPAEQSCTEKYSLSYGYHEHITKNVMCYEISNALISYVVRPFVRDQYSISKLTNPLYQRGPYLSSIYSCNLRGGMYSPSDDNSILAWNVLENKLALIGRVPYDSGSLPGDCFFASLGHSLYNNPNLHFQIRTAGIAHLVSNPELYIESLAEISWENYIQEMSQPGTWCDNIIMQAVSNALNCTIHITDSSPSPNATIISPVNLHQRQKCVFLGYINNIHYVSTLPNTITGNATDNKQKEKLERKRVYAKKQRANETVDAKRLRLEKMAAYRNNRSQMANKSNNAKTKNADHVSQSKYLTEFDPVKYGPLHDQSWAKCNMQQFHKSVQYTIFQCMVCKEAWPITSKPRSPGSYVCSRCSRDKNTPKKFSNGNSMIPGPIPIELQDLSQTEEMLIARALPIMRVYIKPGGQRGYSGHCINLPQHIEELASVLPRYPKDLSVIVIKMKGRDNTFKDVKVRREKVHNALLWLVRNNPHYRDVTINQHALESLPINGVPSDITTVESDSDILSEEITLPDLSPSTDNDEDKVYNQTAEMSSFLPACEKQRQELDAIKNQLFPNEPMSWPTVDDHPLNEYQTPFLATLAFPTLFPDGTGDPTNPSLLRDISLSERIKHLIKFAEQINGKWVYRFASHPRFSYWAFDMIQRRRVLQQSGIFLKQNPGEAHLTIDELREMATSGNSNTFISKISRYVANVAGSNAYWYKVREDLKAIVTTVGTPTFFFTFSSADMHWPELHKLFGNENSTNEERRQAVISNPHIVDWFFTQRLESFIKHWLYKTLDAKWHWYRFEYQARGSIHCHGTAKLNNDPGLCDLTKSALKGFLAQKYKDKNKDIDTSELDDDIRAGNKAAEIACKYVDWLLSTVNPNQPDDGLWVRPEIHPCKKHYQGIQDCDMHDDYCDLLNMVQRHTRCSTSYCLKKKADDSELKCRFNFPMDTCSKTRLQFEEIHTKGNETQYRAKIITKRNDSRLNNNQQLQLQSWRANCDIQVVIDHYACVEYLTKYAAKGEPRTPVLKAAFNRIMSNVPCNSNPHKAIKKVVMKTIGERDYAAQETMHHLLSLKLHSSSFNVMPVSLNGSRRINTSTTEADVCSNNSLLDVYANRAQYNNAKDTAELNFVQFATQFKVVNNKLTRLPDNVVPRIFPTYSCNPRGPNFSQYCKYQLLRYKPWKLTQDNAWDNDEPSDENLINKWQEFLQTPYAKQNVPDWFDKFQCAIQSQEEPEDQLFAIQSESTREEWMIISDLHTPFSESLATNVETAYEWSNDRGNYSEQQIGEMPTWIKNMREASNPSLNANNQNIDLDTFSEMQQLAYNIVRSHFTDISLNKDPLALIINGVAGTGKSYLINAIRSMLNDKCSVTATTGKAAFNINGVTVHSLLKLPVGSRGNKDLTGQNLIRLQESLSNIDYIIIDEYSMLGQVTFGWIDRRLKQTTGFQDKLLGGKSVILCGDPAQLPPVADKPLYHAIPSNSIGEQGHLTYMMFDNVVKLDVNQRVQGNDPEQTRFRELLLRLRKGESTVDDWKLLLTRQPTNIDNLSEFKDATRLFFSNDEVANYNHEQLIKLQEPVAQISARHSTAIAKNISSDEFSGLQPLLFLAKGAKIMLTMNLWPAVGLCNGATGTIVHFIYQNGHQPPDLPLAVIVKFDNYRGPSISQTFPSYVPICPITATAQLSDGFHERQQLPLRLAWAITIHKSQGLTLSKAWINIGKTEKTPGVTYVALSRVRALSSCVIEPFSYERLTSIKSSKMLQYRLREEDRLSQMAEATQNGFH